MYLNHTKNDTHLDFFLKPDSVQSNDYPRQHPYPRERRRHSQV